MVVECKDVSEAVRILRWAASDPLGVEVRVVMRGDGKRAVGSVPAGAFMSAVRRKNEG
jgi:hypothetical protein